MADAHQPSPDALLHALAREENARRRGRLKVFLGMCPGVGKTYAMLEAAHRELAAGRTVAVGLVETHGRHETEALLHGLTVIPRQPLVHREVTLTEMDPDAVLGLRPQLVLVDELAHTNAPGARHPKRWQDVQELRDAGIDVFTTLNVQHVESRADIVRQITGAEIRETVPDRVLDDATLELVDLPPTELLARLQRGLVYQPERAAAAAGNFFREANLTALRELALRLVADHVGADTRAFHGLSPEPGPWKTNHCLLVGVGPSPYSESLIRWARRMADGLQCRWVAVHVEPSHSFPAAAQSQLEKNLATARELGAEVLRTTGDDLAQGLLRVARQQNATQIVLGKPAGSHWYNFWSGDRFLRRLTAASGDIDLLLVRAERGGAREAAITPTLSSPGDPSQYWLAASTIGAVGLLNAMLLPWLGPRVPGLVFLFAVVLLALKVERGPVLLAGSLSALIWDYFFLPPQFTLAISNLEDAILFGLYFVVALVLGQLVSRIKAQELAERRREELAVALYELTRDLAEAGSRDEVVWHLLNRINRVLHAPAALVVADKEQLTVHPDSTLALTEKELGMAAWSFRQKQPAGRHTDNLPGSDQFHLPLVTERKSFGVLVVSVLGPGLSLPQRELLESFARQASLVLDRVELRSAAEQARLLAESEKFSRTLLNSISHELRTPLAASTAAAAALAALPAPEPHPMRTLVQEITEANTRLNRVVGNLLDVARLESGLVRPHPDWHDVRDLVQTTLRDCSGTTFHHALSSQLPPGPLLARLDYSLMQHALANLVLNAVHHTPAGTAIEITANLTQGQLLVSVADRGPGVPAELVPRLFDKFYRGPDAPSGGSGLGLTIVKGFMEAQGGSVTFAHHPNGGAVFTLRLPQPETPPHLAAES